MLSYRSWQLAFGGDSGIIGRSVPLNAGYARIIGVMPNGYGFPVASDAWLPLPASVLAEPASNTQAVDLYGRLANGASARDASSEIARLIDRSHAAMRSTTTPSSRAAVTVESFPMAQIGDASTARAVRIESPRDAHPAARVRERHEPPACPRE